LQGAEREKTTTGGEEKEIVSSLTFGLWNWGERKNSSLCNTGGGGERGGLRGRFGGFLNWAFLRKEMAWGVLGTQGYEDPGKDRGDGP